jgi:hypothetical protein
MADDQPASPAPADGSKPATPLDYGTDTYATDPQRRKRVGREFTKGFALGLMAGALCFVLLFFAGAANFEDTRSRPWSIAGVVIPPVIVLAVFAYALRAQRSKARPGFAPGAFIALGLCALPVGWCYAIVAGTLAG